MSALSETYLTWAERVIQERPLGFLVKKTLCFYTFMEKKCRKEYWEFDPIEWFVVFNRDSSFCKAETNLWEETDMTPVLELANNYFGTAPSVKK